MFSLIHLLPDSVANQIAAGEVIQRPSSVVKELVENAVDAGATHIDVIAVDAGRTSLQVTDDGQGMSEIDARLAFERHATSKITHAEDLFALTTKGFRGEALPSIAAVAQVDLITRTQDDELGTHLRIEGSKVISQDPVACPIGANFQVRNLFFNVPARRKFLKTPQTELNNITTELERIALVHPGISFTLTHNGATLMALTSTSYKQRIAAIFGTRLSEHLLPVNVETTMVTIHGFVGNLESSRRRGTHQFFFANNRYMRHPLFHRAVQEAFQRLIPADEQVPYFIYFDVPPAEIDVNIHPTKTEIKFENEQAIFQILLAAVREALGRFNAIPTIDFDTEGRPADIPIFNPNDPTTTDVAAPRIRINTTFNPFEDTTARASTFDEHPDSSILDTFSNPRSFDGSFSTTAITPSQDEQQTGNSVAPEPLSQYRGQFILATVDSGLMFVDQRRAHLRILYDRYLAELTASPGVTQGLLFPDIVHLSTTDATTLEAIQTDLHALGLEVSALGGDSYAINGLPAGLEGVNPQRLLLDLLASVAERGTLDTEAIHGRLALTLARAAAIPIGQVLSPLEMHDIMNALFTSSSPNYTPDGHPIIVILPQDHIDRLFQR